MSDEDLRRADIYIYSKLPLGRSRDDLEQDIEALLGDDGECIGGGGGKPGWNVDFEVFDPDRLDFWMLRLAEYLHKWGVPPDTYLDSWFGNEHRGRLDVFPTTENAEPNAAPDRDGT